MGFAPSIWQLEILLKQGQNLYKKSVGVFSPSASRKNFWAANPNLLLAQIVELGESCLQLFTFSFPCLCCKSCWVANQNYLRAQHVGPAAQNLETFTDVLFWCLSANFQPRALRTRALYTEVCASCCHPSPLEPCRASRRRRDPPCATHAYAAQHAKPSVTVTGDSNLHKLRCIRARVMRRSTQNRP